MRRRVYPKAAENRCQPERKFWFREKRYGAWQTLNVFLQADKGLRVVLYGYCHRDALFDPPIDFAHLTASFLSGLVPVGVWTDRFEELFPEQAEVIDFLRRWEERKRGIDSQVS